MYGRLIVLLAICLYCSDISSAFHIPTGNTTIMEEPTEDDCQPKAVYVSWTKIRHYVNYHRGLSIWGDYEAPPLEVMRCRNFLTPCPTGHHYCGTSSEKRSIKLLPLTMKGRDTGKVLLLELKEDKACMCVEKLRYDILSSDNVSKPPYIIEAKITEREDRWRNEVTQIEK